MMTSMPVKALMCAAIVGLLGPSPVATAQDREADRELASKLAEADHLRARLARVEAEIDLARYLRETFEPEHRTARGEIALAESELKRAEDRLTWSERMVEKGMVAPSVRDADKLALQKARFAVEQARTKLAVLEEYTQDKETRELRRKIEQARSVEADKRAAYEQTKARPEGSQ